MTARTAPAQPSPFDAARIMRRYYDALSPRLTRPRNRR